jgi:hypothetical protein
MTRRDWWLGILVIVVALVLHAIVTIRAARTPRESGFQYRPLTETAQRF